MNEPQIWTLISVFAAGMFGTVTLISTMFVRMMRDGFHGVRTEFDSVRREFDSVRREFASARAEIASEFASVRTEIRAVNGRIDHLDRDVNAIYRHLFGIDRG